MCLRMCRNYALRVRNIEPLYGFSFPDPVEVSTKTTADGSSVFVLEDKEMDFDEIIKAPLPKAPLEVLAPPPNSVFVANQPGGPAASSTLTVCLCIPRSHSVLIGWQ
jgi:hypothetical protein